MGEKICPNCGGAGEVYVPEWKTHVKCQACQGTGTIK